MLKYFPLEGHCNDGDYEEEVDVEDQGKVHWREKVAMEVEGNCEQEVNVDGEVEVGVDEVVVEGEGMHEVGVEGDGLHEVVKTKSFRE
ncbi:hypothetical protein LR48_Vigan02g130500 [Vigna angularis]|uniref:Uncharacterized protein n=1 Tax=Phaseolus angularis TaxID=3914 RepID=A0A0L9TX88_PHAAN|nr:hypothetical protein LR48_Vigan02g130500 [Vigna angularis]